MDVENQVSTAPIVSKKLIIQTNTKMIIKLYSYKDRQLKDPVDSWSRFYWKMELGSRQPLLHTLKHLRMILETDGAETLSSCCGS